VGQQVQNAVVTPTGLAVQIDRFDQRLDSRPFERLRWQLAAIGSGCLDGVKRTTGLTLVMAKPKEIPQVRDYVLQRVARYLAAAQSDVPFDVGERQLAQVLVGPETSGQEVDHCHRMVFTRRQR
jgi:hypothetical protein